MSQEHLKPLWERYKAAPTPEDRERLILAYLPLVEYVATRMARSLHTTVERQDLISYGTFGLIDAIERYDLEKGIKFETFASYRIRGAIYDELRELDWAPRSVRSKARLVREAIDSLTSELDRPPTDEELLTTVGMTDREYRHLQMDLRADRFDSLDRTVSVGMEGDGSGTVGASVLDPNGDWTYVPQMEEAKHLLARAIPMLSEHDRVMLGLFYTEGLSLRQISEVLQVSESRVSQMQTRAMVNFQRKLAGQP